MSDVLKQPAPTSPQPDQSAEEVSYEWSTARVAEGVAINVVSALIIGIGGIIVAAFYALIVLIVSALHAPGGLLGIVALFILGGILTLVIVIIVVWAFIRRIPPTIAVGMAMGALVGAAIAIAIEQKGGLAAMVAKHAPQDHKENAKTEAANSQK